MLRKALILISYAVTIVVVFSATIILVELGQGYSYDFKTGTFGINGYLSLNSSPSSAELIINGKPVHRSTPYRNTLKTGSYALELRKAGFRTWQKQVDIKPFEVLNLESVFLLPNHVPEQDLTGAQTIASLVASRDRKHFAYVTSDPVPAVWVLDTNHGPGTKVYSPASATTERPAEVITGVSWSDDGSHLLVAGKIAEATVYSLVSANGGTPTNLSDLFRIDLSGLRFSPYDWRELYWNSPEGLRRLNVSNKTTSAVLADKVLGYTFAGDRIIYTHVTPLGQSIWAMDRSGDNQKQLIESLANSSSYQLVYASYHGRDALATIPQGSATATLYLDIFTSNPVSKVISKSAAQVSFSESGRLLAYYGGRSFGVYDLEKNDLITSKPLSSDITCLNWFDPGHLVICRSSEVDLVELDGANMVKISDTLPGMSAYGGADLRHIYGVVLDSSGRTSIRGFQVRL